MTQGEAITSVALRAAVEAGAIALAGFRSPALGIERKSDMHDLVTEYDRACETHIRSIVLGAFPDSAIVGEEGGSVPGQGDLTWYVDPIDGTSNFARGIAMWAVSIGVAQAGEMIAGIIFDPANEQLFWADARGAFLVEGAAHIDALLDEDHGSPAEGKTPWRPLLSRGYNDPEYATVALNFPLARDLVYQPDLALEQFAQVTRAFAQVRGLGSTCIALAWIAAGWLDVTISFETNAWDVAAGAFIIRRAGGIYRGYDESGEVLAEQRDHHARHYYAAVQGGDFALLHEIMRTQSPRGLAE